MEVIKSLAEGEQLIAEFCEPSKRQYEAPPPVPSNIPTKEETDQIPVSTSSTPSPKLANPGEGPSGILSIFIIILLFGVRHISILTLILTDKISKLFYSIQKYLNWQIFSLNSFNFKNLFESKI